MKFQKVAKSFNMHFGEDCEYVCFSAMSLPILEGSGISLCAPISAGGYLALKRRSDGRFTAEFDGNQKYISTNVAELKYHKKEPMLEFLERMKMYGIEPGGADMLFAYNTKIYGGYEPLFLASSYLFCPKTIPPADLWVCLSKRADYASIAGKSGKLLFTDGEKRSHIKFSDSVLKIVLCCIEEKNMLENSESIYIKNAVLSLSLNDYEKFGREVTLEYEKMLKSSGIGRGTKSLFSLAVRLKDALGYGILKNGGIFAIVENRKVNIFIQNVKTEYEKYCGKAPDFYVVRAENSGINAVIRKKDL